MLHLYQEGTGVTRNDSFWKQILGSKKMSEGLILGLKDTAQTRSIDFLK